MSIQDDIFDVRDMLEGKPEAKAFDRICRTFYRLEADSNHLTRLCKNLSEVREILNARHRG